MRIEKNASWLEIVDWLKEEYTKLAISDSTEGVVLLRVVIWTDDGGKEVIKLPVTTVPEIYRASQEELDRWKKKRYVVKSHMEEDSRPIQTLFVKVKEAIDE